MKLKTKNISTFIVIAIILAVAAAIYFRPSTTGNIVQDNKIKIGIITPTTGQAGFVGQNIVKSAQLAVKKLGYTNIELIVEDAGYGDNGKAISAYRKLVDDDKVKLIIDGMSSDGSLAVAPLLEKDNVLMIMPVTGGENIDTASPNLLRNGPSDVYAGTKPANDFNDRYNYKKIVLLTDNAAYTLDIAKHFRNEYKGNIVVDETINPDDTDYRSTLLKIPKDYDALMILTSAGQSGAYIVKELCEQGNMKPIYANFIIYNENTFSIAGNCMEGVNVYYPESNENASLFLKEYEKEYGTKSPIEFHTTGTYDAVKMFVEAVHMEGYDTTAIRSYLIDKVHDWNGMNGKVTFDKNGHVNGGFVLMKVQNGSLVRE